MFIKLSPNIRQLLIYSFFKLRKKLFELYVMYKYIKKLCHILTFRIFSNISNIFDISYVTFGFYHAILKYSKIFQIIFY